MILQISTSIGDSSGDSSDEEETDDELEYWMFSFSLSIEDKSLIVRNNKKEITLLNR